VLVTARSFTNVRRTVAAPGRAAEAVPADLLDDGYMPGEICTALSGTGRLRGADGAPLVDGHRDYAIVVWRRQIAVGGETIPGMKRLSGKVRLKGVEGYRLLVRQQSAPVTLVLEDGRELPVVFSGSDGAFCLSRPSPDWAREL
jgi:hypothetical protein